MFQNKTKNKTSFTRFYRNRTRPLIKVLFRYIDGIVVWSGYIKVENSGTDYSYLFIYFMTFPAFGLVNGRSLLHVPKESSSHKDAKPYTEMDSELLLGGL